MANYNVTPNMNLPNPVPGVDPGPDYANNLQSSLNIVDQHNHSAGQGVPIQPNGLNISSDLPFGGNNATLLNSVRFVSLLTPLANSAPNIGCLYVSGNELYYNDYSGGHQIQITSNGNVNATSSGIANGTASAAFSAGTLVVKSSSTSFANIDMQSAILANSGNLSNQLTLQAPTLSSSYDLTLPTIPSQLSVLTVDTSGNFGFTMNSTAADPVGQAMSSVGANAIGSSMTSAGADAVANTRTRSTGSTVSVGGVASSQSSGNFVTTSTTFVGVTNLSITITTSGRPVSIVLVPDGSSNLSYIGSGAGTVSKFQINRDSGSYVFNFYLNSVASGSFQAFAAGGIQAIDFPSAGTHTYTVNAAVVAGSGSAQVDWAILTAYEL